MVPISDIVKQYLNESGRGDSPHKMRGALRDAINVLREIHYDVNGVPTTIPVTMNANNQIIIPDELVKVVEIFRKSGETKVLLTESGDLSLRRNSINNPDDGNPNFNGGGALAVVEPSSHLNKLGQNIGGYYGLGGDNPTNTYVIDWENAVIQISPNIENSGLYMTYMTDPQQVNGKFMVDPMMREVLIAGIGWYQIRNRTYVPANLKQYSEKKFYDKLDAYSARLQPALTKQSLISLGRNNVKRAKF